MRKLISISLLGVLILFTGCIRSLHPIYTEDSVVFETNLLGEWAEEDAKDFWTFSEGGTNEYKLVYTDKKGKQGVFSAHLLKIEGHLFLDFFPEEPDVKANDFYHIHLLPVHTFVYVKQITPTLQMIFPEPDWLKKLLADNPQAIRHEKVEGQIILTAETKALQAFWLKHLETEGAFGDASNMKRKTSTSPEK